jgi:hypothetical protein
MFGLGVVWSPRNGPLHHLAHLLGPLQGLRHQHRLDAAAEAVLMQRRGGVIEWGDVRRHQLGPQAAGRPFGC